MTILEEFYLDYIEFDYLFIISQFYSVLMFSNMVIQLVLSIECFSTIFTLMSKRIREVNSFHMLHQVNFLCAFFPTKCALPAGAII